MLKIAVIGTGFIGNTHAEACERSKYLELIGIVDKNQDAGRKAADRFGCKYYDDMMKMMEEEEVDIVDICLPTFLHEEYVLAALEKGKHVICEKPVSLTLESVEKMIHTAQRVNRKFMVAQVVRFWPEYAKIKEMYDKGRFGKIRMVYGNRIAQHPNWTSWHCDPKKSGGCLFDLHLHDIDFAFSMFGEVKDVYAVGWKTEQGCWDHIVSILNFKNGVKAVIEGSYAMPAGYPFTTNFRVVGEECGIEYLMKAGINLEDLDSSSRTLIEFDSKKEPKCVETETGKNPYQEELEYFAKCVEEDCEIQKIKPEDSRQVIRLMLAIQESLEKGFSVEL